MVAGKRGWLGGQTTTRGAGVIVQASRQAIKKTVTKEWDKAQPAVLGGRGRNQRSIVYILDAEYGQACVSRPPQVLQTPRDVGGRVRHSLPP